MSEIPRSLTNQEKFFVPPMEDIFYDGSRLLVVVLTAFGGAVSAVQWPANST